MAQVVTTVSLDIDLDN